MGKISEKDILQICQQFERLDTGNCGKITLADLMESHPWSSLLTGHRTQEISVDCRLNYWSPWRVNRVQAAYRKITQWVILPDQLVPYYPSWLPNQLAISGVHMGFNGQISTLFQPSLETSLISKVVGCFHSLAPSSHNAGCLLSDRGGGQLSWLDYKVIFLVQTCWINSFWDAKRRCGSVMIWGLHQMWIFVVEWVKVKVGLLLSPIIWDRLSCVVSITITVARLFILIESAFCSKYLPVCVCVLSYVLRGRRGQWQPPCIICQHGYQAILKLKTKNDEKNILLFKTVVKYKRLHTASAMKSLYTFLIF